MTTTYCERHDYEPAPCYECGQPMGCPDCDDRLDGPSSQVVGCDTCEWDARERTYGRYGSEPETIHLDCTVEFPPYVIEHGEYRGLELDRWLCKRHRPADREECST